MRFEYELVDADRVPSYKWRVVGLMSHEQADVVMIVMNTPHTHRVGISRVPFTNLHGVLDHCKYVLYRCCHN